MFHRIDKIDDSAFVDSETLVIHPVGTEAPRQETYDHILDVIDHQEAVMSFQYVDKKNKVIILILPPPPPWIVFKIIPLRKI